jgi:hypothetical protein
MEQYWFGWPEDELLCGVLSLERRIRIRGKLFSSHKICPRPKPMHMHDGLGRFLLALLNEGISNFSFLQIEIFIVIPFYFQISLLAGGAYL